MLYLAIDQHRKQLTVNVRNEQGDVVLKRQVSTEWERVRAFFADLRERARAADGFVAILEVCGFNDWLLTMLVEYGCRETILVQPEKRSKKKTDRRDADTLGEILWVNRERLLAGKKVQGLRRVRLPSAEDAENRHVTALRWRLGRCRTRTLNQIKYLLRKHNLEQECPTKGLDTIAGRAWLARVALGSVDRLELDQLLVQWKLWDEQLEAAENDIAQRQARNPTARWLATIPGCAAYGSLALASRLDPVERFASPKSLANYWGLTPRCRNSGEATDRLGSITKQGSALARFLLAQIVVHVLRRDRAMKAWYQPIKRRRGSKIARVAVMRRLATIIQQMVKRQEPYRCGGASPGAASSTPNTTTTKRRKDGAVTEGKTPTTKRPRGGAKTVDFRRHDKVSTEKKTAPNGRRPSEADAPVAHLAPALPCQVASPQSPTPLHRAQPFIEPKRSSSGTNNKRKSVSTDGLHRPSPREAPSRRTASLNSLVDRRATAGVTLNEAACVRETVEKNTRCQVSYEIWTAAARQTYSRRDG